MKDFIKPSAFTNNLDALEMEEAVEERAQPPIPNPDGPQLGNHLEAVLTGMREMINAAQMAVPLLGGAPAVAPRDEQVENADAESNNNARAAGPSTSPDAPMSDLDPTGE